MKKILLAFIATTISLAAIAAKPVTKVFHVDPQMTCQNCEKKIKSNLRFEKGVKNVETNISTQEVVVKYDPDKTNPDALAEALSKIGYTAFCDDEDCTNRPNASCNEQKSCCKEAKSCCEK